MRDATRASYFCAMFPRMSDIARSMGYALCVHGSMTRDFDLIAVPWLSWAKPAGELVDKFIAEMGFTIEPQNADNTPRIRQHGRLAWVLHIDHRAYVDLSVMPRLEYGCPVQEETR